MANTAIDFWRPENVRGKCSENLWKFTANEPPYTDELLNVLDLFKSNVIQSGKCWLTQTSNGMVWNLGRSNGACGRGKLTTQQQIELISGSINPNPTGICLSLSLTLFVSRTVVLYFIWRIIKYTPYVCLHITQPVADLVVVVVSLKTWESWQKAREIAGEGGVEGVVGVANCPSYALNFLKSAQVV